MLKSLTIAAAAALLMTSAPAATIINYPSFSSVAGLTLNGNATQSGNTLSLTTAAGGEAGSAWYSSLVNVVNGFDTSFQYNLSGGSGADGITFTVQTQGTSALGVGGGGLGANGITNAVSTAFRTYVYNDVEVDSCGQNVGVSVGSCVVASNSTTTRGLHTARVVYTPGTIQVYLDGVSQFTASLNLANAIVLSGGTSAYVGFTGGTGGATDNQVINSWTLATPDAVRGVPEPATFALMLSALGGLCLTRKYCSRSPR